MTTNAVTRILANALADRVPAISIQAYEKIADGVFATVFTTERPNYSGDELRGGMSRLFTGAFAIADDTLVRITNPYYNLYRAVIQANTESHEFNEDVCTKLGLKLTTANVFVDPENMVWKVVGEGEGKRLVLTSMDDYEQILGAKRSRQIVTASLDEPVSYAFGDYVMFFNPTLASVDFGYALAPNTVLSRTSGATTEVHPHAVVEAAVGAVLGHGHLKLDLAQFEETALARDGKDAFLQYWKQLYANTPVYDELEKIMREQVM